MLDADIHTLFANYNEIFFKGKLVTTIVEWSKRMTTCAGLCYSTGEGFYTIRLSQPLLKYRSVQELHETLLHEMIHAYLFMTEPGYSRDNDGHGANFQAKMREINKETGYNISVYHTFHKEVNRHLNHIWLWDGPCQKKAPYYGVVKRATNRAPGKNDYWWESHKKNWGGTFNKIWSKDDIESKQKPRKQVKEEKKVGLF